MIWVGIVFALLFVGMAWRFREIGRQPCPQCGHRKFEHTIFAIDGVVLGPYRCKRCGKQCQWSAD